MGVLDTIVRDNAFMRKVIAESYGVHLLRQDPWETLVCFIISQQNNISRIRKCVETLVDTAGHYDADKGYTYFPTPQNILATNLNGLGLGYRADYIHSAAAMVANGDLVLPNLNACLASYEEAMNTLTGIYGVGVKVANCVCLFGLDFVDAFPVDVHIKRILALPEMQSFRQEDYTGYLGLVQQYLYSYSLKHGI